MNPVVESLVAHRTIRSFRPDAIEDETVGAILEAGTRAATGGYFQPYSFIVIDDPKLIERIAPYSAPVAVLVVVDHHRFQRFLEFHDAVFPINSPLNLLLAYWDAVIALQNVVVAAESLGLGTVYIGDVPSKELGEPLGLPDDVFPAGLVVVGHPAQDPDRRRRLPAEAVVHHNRYHVPTDGQVRSWYRRYGEILEKEFDELPEEERAQLQRAGIGNGLQKFCRDMVGFFDRADHHVLTNLARGGFEIADWV